jgi:hypothetical protein
MQAVSVPVVYDLAGLGSHDFAVEVRATSIDLSVRIHGPTGLNDLPVEFLEAYAVRQIDEYEHFVGREPRDLLSQDVPHPDLRSSLAITHLHSSQRVCRP